MTSRILDDIHNSVKNLHQTGVIDTVTMRKFDELCLDVAEKHPSGAALRLLHIIKDHGIAIIVTSNVDKEMKKSSLKFSKPQSDLGAIVDRRELKTRNNGN